MIQSYDDQLPRPKHEVLRYREVEAPPGAAERTIPRTEVLYAGDSRKAAQRIYGEYRRQFRQGVEPADDLMLLRNGEPVKAYHPEY